MSAWKADALPLGHTRVLQAIKEGKTSLSDAPILLNYNALDKSRMHAGKFSVLFNHPFSIVSHNQGILIAYSIIHSKSMTSSSIK